MKIIIAIIELFIFCTSYLFPVVSNELNPPPSYEATYDNLGIPLSEYYENNQTSKSVWDLKVYDNKLFIGGGDYDKNTGPVPVYYYDLSNQKWIMSGEVPDEQIDRFFIVDDNLMIPGCDPRQNWDLGNIYEYKNNSWITNRSIPGGIHQFDLTSYDGLLFAALGVVAGEYPIAVSSDGGNTFKQVTMYKNGEPLDTSVPIAEGLTSYQIRVYDFFILDNELYAFYYYYTNLFSNLEIYKFENNAFHYYCDFPETITRKKFSYSIFTSEAEYDDKLFLTTGNLYITNNLKEVSRIDLPNQKAVSDLQVINGKLYALAFSITSDGNYRTSLWLYSSAKESFREVLYFTFPCPAISFTYHNGKLYFGMGSGLIEEDCSHIGTILSVNHIIS